MQKKNKEFIILFINSINDLTKSRKSRLTRILAIHERQSLVLVTKPFAIIILAPRQVLPEHLRVKFGISSHQRGRRRRRIAIASHGQRLPAPDWPNSGETLRQGGISARCKMIELQRENHARESSENSISSNKLRQRPLLLLRLPAPLISMQLFPLSVFSLSHSSFFFFLLLIKLIN